MPSRGAVSVSSRMAASAWRISRRDFSSVMRRTSRSAALPFTCAARSSSALASSTLARRMASWRSWYSRSASRSAGMAAEMLALSRSVRFCCTANSFSAVLACASASVRTSSFSASETESFFSSSSAVKVELSSSTSFCPFLTCAPSCSSQRTWSCQVLVRGTSRCSACAAASSPVSRRRGRNVPRWTVRSAVFPAPGASACTPPTHPASGAARRARATRAATGFVRLSIWFKTSYPKRIRNSLARCHRRGRRRPRRPEIDLGRRLGSGLRLEIRPRLEAHGAGQDDRREGLDARVVRLRHLVEAAALDGDAVLRPFELGHQIAEALHGLQVRIALHHHQQPRQGGRELVLRLLELRELLRIVQDRPRRLGGHLADPAARLDHLGERGLLVARRSLDARHQVRDQVGPALIDVLHLRPLRVHRLARADQAVVETHPHEAENHGDDDDGDQTTRAGFHSTLPSRGIIPSCYSHPA